MAKSHPLDRRNVSIATLQLAYDVASLTAALARFEDRQSTVWAEAAHHDIIKIKAAPAEIEAIIGAVPSTAAAEARREAA